MPVINTIPAICSSFAENGLFVCMTFITIWCDSFVSCVFCAPSFSNVWTMNANSKQLQANKSNQTFSKFQNINLAWPFRKNSFWTNIICLTQQTIRSNVIILSFVCEPMIITKINNNNWTNFQNMNTVSSLIVIAIVRTIGMYYIFGLKTFIIPMFWIK